MGGQFAGGDGGFGEDSLRGLGVGAKGKDREQVDLPMAADFPELQRGLAVFGGQKGGVAVDFFIGVFDVFEGGQAAGNIVPFFLAKAFDGSAAEAAHLDDEIPRLIDDGDLGGFDYILPGRRAVAANDGDIEGFDGVFGGGVVLAIEEVGFPGGIDAEGKAASDR